MPTELTTTPTFTHSTTTDRSGYLYLPTLMTTPPETTDKFTSFQTDQPSPLIDRAIIDLLARINHFSDDHFDTAFVTLDESELESLVVLLLQHWTNHMDGRLLAGYLLVLREGGTAISGRSAWSSPASSWVLLLMPSIAKTVRVLRLESFDIAADQRFRSNTVCSQGFSC